MESCENSRSEVCGVAGRVAEVDVGGGLGDGYWGAVASYYAFCQEYLRVVGNSGVAGVASVGVSSGGVDGVECSGSKDVHGCCGSTCRKGNAGIEGSLQGVGVDAGVFVGGSAAGGTGAVTDSGKRSDIARTCEGVDVITPVVGLRTSQSSLGDGDEPVFEGGSCGSDTGKGIDRGGSVSGGTVRVLKPKNAGDNWQRNRDARAKKKAGKKARQQAIVEVERESSGFWKSCPEEVRQQLIRSKAEMHIAENLRRAREDRKKVERMDSPEGYVVEALKMLKLASEVKKVDNDNKVAGWATVVANECAETIAKSVPSTAKSYEDFVASQGGISSRSSAPDVPLESKPQVVVERVEVPVEKIVEKIVKVEVPVVKYVDKVKYVPIPPEGGRPKPSKDLSFGVTFKNPIERAVVAMGMIDDRQLLDARRNFGRELGYADFVGAEGKKKYKLTKNHVVQLMEVELQRVF